MSRGCTKIDSRFWQNRGFSLVEAVLASFLLLTAIILSAHVFDSSLQVESNNEQRIMASIAADSAMAEIRAAANLDYPAAISTYNGFAWANSDYPNFRVRSTIEPAILALPCTELEGQYGPYAPRSLPAPGEVFPIPNGRYLNSSASKVDVDVSWGDKTGGQSIRLTEFVTNLSPANDFLVQIILPDSSVADPAVIINAARDQVIQFGARARLGANGPEVEDIQFSWFVEPLDGFGSIHRVSRDGKICRYKNAYRNYNNLTKHDPGNCRLVLKATLQGLEATAKVVIENG